MNECRKVCFPDKGTAKKAAAARREATGHDDIVAYRCKEPECPCWHIGHDRHRKEQMQ